MSKSESEIKKYREHDKMIKKKCATIISEFVEKYGCKKKALCQHCGCTYPTLNKMLRGSEKVRIDLYICALWFIGEKYIDTLKLCDV